MADPIKVKVDVEGSEAMKELTKEIKVQQKEIQTWNSLLAQQLVGQQQHAAGVAAATAKIAAANKEMKNIQTASGDAGRGLSQLAYAVDDVQYGFNAIVNNIPQIVMGLGGSAGLAGAIGIAAVAINQLIKHWAEVTSLFEAGWSNRSADQLTAVKKAAEEAADAYVKLAKARSEWEDKSDTAIKKAVTAAGGADKMRTALTATLGVSGEGAEMTDSERLVANSLKNADPALKERIMARVTKRIMEKNAKEVEDLMGKLASDDDQISKGARERIIHLMEKNPEAFNKLDPQLIQNFKDSDPAKMRAKEEAEDFAKAKKKIEDKEDQINKQRWQERKHQLQEEKDARVQGLEDERQAVQLAQHEFDRKMWERQHADHAPAAILQGAKAVTDYYQTGTRADDPKVLAKEAHDQREKTFKELQEINKNIQKERRLKVPT